ncbi:MAG: UvrABC system protein A [Cyclobacteriaceae bacterium]|nr:MAG: UvrABC system protein A [Cyclobacteriaceae bacterium]
MPALSKKRKKTPVAAGTAGYDTVEVIGAREHNLKNITVSFPRNKLVVITGISGSGKSSLAFDTLYAEGQRRYLESFSAYARNFIGSLERPDVDKINGLSPVISIEQKTTSRNPRSTVGTVTEIYDFLRLLFARTAEAYSYLTGEKMTRQSEDQIVDSIIANLRGKKLTLLAPVVKGRKGHYRELFQQIRKLGFAKVRVDGTIQDLAPKMQVDRYKVHDIEIVIDRIVASPQDRARVSQSVNRALKEGKGIIQVLEENGTVHYFSKYLMDPRTGLSYDEPAPNTFSFNSPYGACPVCNGLGEIQEITEESVIPDKNLSISRGGILPLGAYRDIWIFKKIEAILKRYHCTLTTPIKNIPAEALRVLLYGDDVPVSVPSVKYPGTEWNTRFEGIVNFLEKQREEGSENVKQWVEDFTITRVCPECQGKRLKKEALHFFIDGKNIADLAMLDLGRFNHWLSGLEDRLTEKQRIIATGVLKEIRKRTGFLLDVGLEYLHLNRPLKTLSGGEAQRIRLATQIGTQLTGVMYILDEPSIGLHARDNTRLIGALKSLRDLGNTVLVVEHDREMMLEADYLLDIGPGAGRHGGQVVAQGEPPEFLKCNSATSGYLKGQEQIPYPSTRRKGNGKMLVLSGASGHNLKHITVSLPLGTFICITGVSGSGKSTLIHDTLYPILMKHFYGSRTEPLPYDKIEGIEHLDKVIEVDQSPIGRTPRSSPATYTGVFTDIRDLFAQLPEAKIRGYKPGRFSFNVKGGRCETCQGGGLRVIEMEFLPDVQVPCETCKGRRYNRETLEVRYRGKSIADVLNMTVEEAVGFFENHPRILRKIKTLEEVGLGYLSLGQHATTLSGGEAQRIKLATELAKRDTGKTLYIFDEPTTGLHFQDIAHLLNVLQKLVEKGNTVLVIEHNMDVIRAADYLIDLGPEGGDGGGHIVAAGTPEEVAQNANSHTGRYLLKELNR